MSYEEEFIRWLNRPEKTFEENLSFALKAWKSSEFTLFTKYEKVIEWFGEKIKLLGKSTADFQDDLFNEFLQLKCRPGLISLDIKRNFVCAMVEWAKSWQSHESRKPVEVLYKISELEMMQDLFRSEYDAYARVMGQAFRNYEKYLRGFEDILVGSESEFFGAIMESVKSRAKKAGKVKVFEEKFTAFATQPLVELIIVFQSKGVKFFNDLLELEKTLFLDYVESKLLSRCLKLPIHVRLVTFECAIVNYRGDVVFFSKLANAVFADLTGNEVIANPELSLTDAACILEMLRKHDISLNFSVNPTQTALQFFGDKVAAYTQKFHEAHLLGVLKLLCATLRLNPLILEKTVFDITAKMMLAKKGDTEQEAFEEYLLLLMEMFRKLSRAEKFVASLQKSVKELLKTQKVPKKSKRRRTITDSGEGVGGKRLKLEDGEEVNSSSLEDNVRFYLDVIFKEFHAPNEGAVVTSKISSFSHISFAWPAPSAGVSFSKLIAGLMSKPSLVIWKTLIYAFKDLLTATTILDDNALFLFDFYSSLICQYFAGCKLPEQSDKFWKEVEANREITRGTLQEFGHFLLAQEHNNRTMNAFLECCYYAGLFDLVLWYYRPDFMADDEEFQKSSKNLHGYLSDDEWVLLQQRIVNFGRVECKFNANRLLIQRLKAKMLFHHKKLVHLHKFMLAPVGADLEQAKLVLNRGECSWLLGHMSASEKQEMCRVLVEELDYETIRHFTEDMDALTTIVLELYKSLAGVFVESKKSILSAIDLEAGVETLARAVVDKKDGYTVKAVEADKARDILDVMAKLPMGCCRKTDKALFVVLQLAVYRDLRAAGEEELAAAAFSILTDMLHFGQPIQVFQHFPLERLVAIVPPSGAAEFYEFIFSTLRYDVDAGEKFLDSVQEILSTNQSDLTKDHVTMLLTTIDALNQSTHKKLKRFLESVLTILECHVNGFFTATDGRKSKKDKSFVEKTLRGFVVHATAVLTKITDAKDLDENFRRVCKIYIGYSMDCHNAHAIKLIMLALTHRTTLHFDQDEIEFVLNSYWKQLNEDLKTAKLDEKTAEPVIKIIISNKTNEDLLVMLKKIGKDIAKEDFGYICRLLGLMAKCPFSTIKGAIFNEHFKLITLGIVLRLDRDDEHKLVDFENVLSVLDCQKAIVENSKIPMSSDTVDDILALLIDINIKRFTVGDTNIKLFNRIHLGMIEVCTALIKHRHMLLMDRIPHFVHIFKDLVQAVCWYKSDRQKDTTLSPEELDNLAELAMKLESLMHLIAKHNVELKRVAPYTLTFVINLMVSNARSTTLYPKIKTHIENICYDLVALCDHRVGGFILRCSNEASRQVYETLVKDHKKYHKFKGKV